jgi:hypothetical protein
MNLQRALRKVYTEMYAGAGALVCARRAIFIASVIKDCPRRLGYLSLVIGYLFASPYRPRS